MSRHHRTGQPSARDARAALQRQVALAMYEKLEESEYRYMSQVATILNFVFQYGSVSLEDFIEHYNGNNCEFTVKLRNKGKVAMKACDDFMAYFEPLILPENKAEWANDYGQFQQLLDNWFRHDRDAYQKGSDAARAKEICRAAALRYHDPMEKNPQRCFEAGFREGAAYADLHPIDSVTIKQGDTVKQLPLRELMDAYAEKHNVEVTLTTRKPCQEE